MKASDGGGCRGSRISRVICLQFNPTFTPTPQAIHFLKAINQLFIVRYTTAKTQLNNRHHVLQRNTDHNNSSTSNTDTHNNPATSPTTPNLRHSPTSPRPSLASRAISERLHSRHLSRTSSEQRSSHTRHLSLCTTYLNTTATRLQRCCCSCTVSEEQDKKSVG